MKILSNFIDGISGSVGGITGAGGLGGMYLKQKPIPTNPRTTRQQTVRAALASAVVAWQGGTVAQRLAWSVFGATCTYRNNTGATIRLNGWNAYSRAFVVLTQASIATTTLITTAPALTGYLANTPLALEQDITTPTSLTVENMGNIEVNLSIFTGQVTRTTINNYPASFQWFQVQLLPGGGKALIETMLATGRNWFRFQAYTTDGNLSRGQILFIDTVILSQEEKKKK